MDRNGNLSAAKSLGGGFQTIQECLSRCKVYDKEFKAITGCTYEPAGGKLCSARTSEVAKGDGDPRFICMKIANI